VAKHSPQGGKTRTIKWQNSCHKAAKTYTKRWQTHCMLKKNFPAHQKKSFVQQKNSICTAKIAISTFSHTLVILLSFWHTSSYFHIFSQLLAHCADLRKSEGQLCCCHETGLKLVLFFRELISE